MSSLLYASPPGWICSSHFFPRAILFGIQTLWRDGLTGLAWVSRLSFGWAGESTWLTVPRSLPVRKGNPQRRMRRVTGRKQGCQTDTDTGSPLSQQGRLPSSCHHSNHCQLTDLCPHTTWGPQRQTLVNQVKAYGTRWHPQLKSLPVPEGPDTMSCSSS